MTTIGAKAFQLPPLILHPFSSSDESSLLMESSRASLILQGFAPRDQTSTEELERQLLRGRYAELRMLFYIGKDVSRWAEQCVECTRASGHFTGRRIRPETFAILLLHHLPVSVRSKLEGWGVLDYCALFRRSFGLHAVFQELPDREAISQEFLRRYHRYLDQWYEQRLRDFVFDRAEANDFTFELYASGEYSSMLEASWAKDTASDRVL
ncbi:MAG: hypothetical protein M3Y72_19405 [Acidobacteriota bacterium]|nr:hypothetical protein [Acidobacteriota bacterium]